MNESSVESDSEGDRMHQQYLREKPLLEEIKLLRVARDDMERRLRATESENYALIGRVRELVLTEKELRR